MAKRPALLEPIHPGEVLREDFMKPLHISINGLARDLVVPPGRISAIAGGKRAISADTALRLSRYFGMTPQFWLNLQSEYDLRVALRRSGPELEARIRPRAG
jgi:antitoxin HigA-1